MSPVEGCPQCGGSLDDGSLGLMTYVGGAAWYKGRSALALGGESIVAKPLGGMVWMDGHRCRACRLLLLSY
jgi:hypothetical protein